MATVKTRKQGNAITVTIPKRFNIPSGVKLEPTWKPDGIFFKFIESDDKNSFDEYILRDVIAEKYEGEDIVKEFMNRKRGINKALQYAIDDARDNGSFMTREDFENEFGL